MFAALADDFLIAYAEQSGAATPAMLFTVGHAVELYLKAALVAQNANTDPKKSRHRVDDMLKTVQGWTPPLLAGYVLRASVPPKFMAGPVPVAMTADPDYGHYVAHQELYWVANFLADLKYLGASHVKLPLTYAVSAMSRNPVWLLVLIRFRGHLTKR
jgi:hypothetical protein